MVLRLKILKDTAGCWIFLSLNHAPDERKSRDQIGSEINKDSENYFYFERKQWRTIFSPKIFNAKPVRTPLVKITKLFVHHKMHIDA